MTVIDATGAAARPDMTVIIAGDRITAIGSSRKVKAPKGSQVIDATGKFLIPGLWDMHVHLGSNDLLLPFYVANGVTGVRSMSDSVENISKFRRQVSAGELIGPRIVATAGPIVDGPNPLWEGSIIASTEAEGRQAINQAKALGAEFIKVYEVLTRAAYFGIAGEARRQGIAFAGHVPRAVSVAEASDAGQASIEHMLGIPLACSSRETEIRARMLEATADARPSNGYVRYTAYGRADAEAYQSYDAGKAEDLFRRFVKNKTRITPTLTEPRASWILDKTDLSSDPRMRYMPSNLAGYWNSSIASSLSAEEKAKGQKGFERRLNLVGAMSHAGVEILAGTDTPRPFCFPGSGLHDELSLLVSAGLTPMQALQAATRNAARFLGMLDSFGATESGKVADVVLLDANPLEKIENTQRIAAVIFDGRFLSKDTLQRMQGVGSAENRKGD